MNYTSTRGTVAVNETYALLHGLAEGWWSICTIFISYKLLNLQ